MLSRLPPLVALLTACAGDASSGVGPGAGDDANHKPAGAPASLPPATGVNALAGSVFWVNPVSDARRTADSWRTSRPADAIQMDKLADRPQVGWFGEWNTNVTRDVDAAAAKMAAGGALPVLVAYNIPHRDCSGLSGDNTTTASAYRSWIDQFAAGIGVRRAAVILEPDALSAMDCLSPADQDLRFDLINYAVQTLHAKGNIAIYLDAGNPGWQPAATIADRLARAGIGLAQGFSLNVSNFLSTPANLTYGRSISALVGNRHFIIDTGRNGVGGNGQWCNPSGRSLGERPTTQTGETLVDAFLWVKTPGESDGACNDGQASGTWMPEYALGLARRAAY